VRRGNGLWPRRSFGHVQQLQCLHRGKEKRVQSILLVLQPAQIEVASYLVASCERVWMPPAMTNFHALVTLDTESKL
jgi:hypothetical protein